VNGKMVLTANDECFTSNDKSMVKPSCRIVHRQLAAIVLICAVGICPTFVIRAASMVIASGTIILKNVQILALRV